MTKIEQSFDDYWKETTKNKLDADETGVAEIVKNLARKAFMKGYSLGIVNATYKPSAYDRVIKALRRLG